MKCFSRNRLINTEEINMKPNSLGGCLFYAFCFIFGLYFAVYFVAAVVGLATGHLYLMPARGAPEQTIHGVWARIVSGIILIIFAALVGLFWRHNRKTRAPKSENNKDSGGA